MPTIQPRALPRQSRIACALLLGLWLGSPAAQTETGSDAATVAAAGRIVVTDDVGHSVALAAPATRIVSLAPHITESLFAAGAGERVVGVSAGSDHPEAAGKLPRVGGPAGGGGGDIRPGGAGRPEQRFDLAAIAALKPDLLIVWEDGAVSSHIPRLKRLGVPLYVSKPRRIDDVAANIERYGELAGTQEIARGAAQAFRARHAELRKRYGARPAVRMFYQIGHQIGSQPLTTANGEQLVSDVMRLCGAENIFAGRPQALPAVTLEEVLVANPEAVVVSGREEERVQRLEMWRHWPRLDANLLNNRFFIATELIDRPGPRILDGARRLCEQMERARARRGQQELREQSREQQEAN
ncbi:putative vitamin B12 transport protein [Sterolibacterium denitrificans]|uniref:Vitamin B12 transport protein n=1 Tax=Sterolibacterium denitrificans TaxID=157592 RepID=A0A7Z7MUB4_9PROT|nr:cobalamin-binding protein [Sterolibacterium denitrificans]SMB21899.1 putative vitamin B12 transport protein [Sterolibacterium denitrificans]